MGFSVLHLHSCGQKVQTTMKISKYFVKNMFFKQNSKISGIPSLHHFIPAVVIIKSKEFSLKCIHKTITAIERNCRNFNGGHYIGYSSESRVGYEIYFSVERLVNFSRYYF